MDAFQGKEKELIIFTAVRSKEQAGPLDPSENPGIFRILKFGFFFLEAQKVRDQQVPGVSFHCHIVWGVTMINQR